MDMAQREQHPVNDFVEDLLKNYETATFTEDLPVGSLARLATAGREIPSFSAKNDVSEHVVEILRNEFTDHLLKRIDRPADE